jgi:hypothetical protein
MRHSLGGCTRAHRVYFSWRRLLLHVKSNGTTNHNVEREGFAVAGRRSHEHFYSCD